MFMLQKWIFKNKYKLMVFIAISYIVVDILLHKGLARFLLPDEFPVYKISSGHPGNKNMLINENKESVNAVNTKEALNKIRPTCSGLECDIYIDADKRTLDVHHD